MLENEIVKSDYNLSNDVNLQATLAKNEYQLAKISRIFFARFFDFIFSSIPGIVLSYFYTIKPNQWSPIVIIFSMTLVWLIIYFVGIPKIFFQGSTIGKKIFLIKLVTKQNDNKIKTKWLLQREFQFTIIPWIILFISQFIPILIMFFVTKDNWNGVYDNVSKIISNGGYFLYFLYFVVLCWSIKAHDQNQAGIDVKNKLWVINRKKSIPELTKKNQSILSRNDHHISLEDQPANFSDDVIEALAVDPNQELISSISLDRKKFQKLTKIETTDPKLIDLKQEESKDE